MMPAWSDSPVLLAMLDDVAGGDASAADMAVTWLVDEVEASIGDVLMWYACPPTWLRDSYVADEAAREVLWRWLKEREPDHLPLIPIGEGGFSPRWVYVRETQLDVHPIMQHMGIHPTESRENSIRAGLMVIKEMPKPHWEDRQLFELKKVACLKQKREVLKAFDEVKMQSRFDISERDVTLLRAPSSISRFVGEHMKSKGFRGRPFASQNSTDPNVTHEPENRRYVCIQTLAAPDWIPEPQHIRRTAHSEEILVVAVMNIPVNSFVRQAADGTVGLAAGLDDAIGVAITGAADAGDRVRVRITTPPAPTTSPLP